MSNFTRAMCRIIPFGFFSFLILLLPDKTFGQCSFTISTSVTNVSCYNGTTGQIVVTSPIGSNYQYQLADAGAGAYQTSNTFTGLAASNYPVTVREISSGCVQTIYVTVTQPTAFSASYTSQDGTCTGSNNGSINITTTGGTSPYSYSWLKNGSAFSTSANLSGLAPGNYLLTVTDANGCTTTPVITSQARTIGLSGFTEDVVADGTNTASSSAVTTSVDQPTGNVFYASGYTNSSGIGGSGGLPASGSFTSVQSASRPYQLAPYSSNNTLLLASSNGSGAVTSGVLGFTSAYQSPYSILWVVGSTGSGTGTANYTVTFSDNSTITGSVTFADWSLSAGTASSVRALGNLDRISVGNPGSYFGGTNFNLWEAPISIPVGSQGLAVNSVTFSWAGASSARINLFAITGYTSTIAGIRINDGPASNVTPAVTVASDAPSNTFCSGQNVTFTATPTNGGSSPSYQWKLNGSNVGTNAPTYSNNSLNNGNLVSVVMTTSGLACVTSTTASSSAVTMTLGTVPASVSASSSVGSSICSGTSATFTATPVNGGTSPSYQWLLNGSNVGTNSPTYTNASLTNGNTVSVVMTSSIGCATGNPATATPITMTVNANLTPTVAITSVPAVTFSSTITNGGSSPGYQWYKNGSQIGGATSATYTTNSAAIGDVYSLKLTSSYACATAPAAMSNYITVTPSTLPVILTSYTLSVDGKNVILGWTTSMEYQDREFLIQRASSSSGPYETIGTVTATNSPTGSAYSFTDQPGIAGTYFYRLVQVDMDDNQQIMGIKSATLSNLPGWLVTDLGTSWQVYSNQQLTYTLFDMSGRILQQGSFSGTKQITKPMSSAVYLLRVIYNGQLFTRKLVKQ